MMYPWFKPSIDKKSNFKNIKKMFDENKLTMGEYCYNLENEIKKILKVKYVILTTSGTSALMLASIAAGITKNKKVYASDMSWVASVNPAKILGADIELIDTKNKSDQVDFKILNQKIKNKNPFTVILSHLNGEPTYDQEFNKLKSKKKFFVIEDCAQAFPVKYKKKYCGTIFDIGCYSLSITKLITMVYGGFCVTNSKLLADKMKAIRNNGLDAQPENAWLQVSSELGLNLKPSNLLAHIGKDNLQHYKKNISIVNKIHDHYLKNINNKKILIVKKKTKNSLPIYVYAYIKNRLKFINFCKKNRIGIHLGFRGLHENGPFLKDSRNYKNSLFFPNTLLDFLAGQAIN